jgi:hypothetical protein
MAHIRSQSHWTWHSGTKVVASTAAQHIDISWVYCPWLLPCDVMYCRQRRLLYNGCENLKYYLTPFPTDISQYRLRFGSSLLYKSVLHLNRLTAQLSYEGRAAVEGGK